MRRLTVLVLLAVGLMGVLLANTQRAESSEGFLCDLKNPAAPVLFNNKVYAYAATRCVRPVALLHLWGCLERKGFEDAGKYIPALPLCENSRQLLSAFIELTIEHQCGDGPYERKVGKWPHPGTNQVYFYRLTVYARVVDSELKPTVRFSPVLVSPWAPIICLTVDYAGQGKDLRKP